MTTSRRLSIAEPGGLSESNGELAPGRATRESTRPSDRSESTPGIGGLWNIADASRYLQIPTSSIYKMTARKAAVRIPHIRIGGKLRFRQADLDRWLTLLTVSNLDEPARMHQKVSKVTHGHHSQAAAR